MYNKLLSAYALVSSDKPENVELGTMALNSLVGNDVPTFEDAVVQMLAWKWNDLYHDKDKDAWKERRKFMEYVNSKTTEKGSTSLSSDYGMDSRSIGVFCGVEVSFNTYTFTYLYTDLDRLPSPNFYHADAGKICPIVDRMEKAMYECQLKLKEILDDALSVIDQGSEIEVGRFMYHMDKARSAHRLDIRVPHDYEVIPRLNKRFSPPVELKLGDFVAKDGCVYIVTSEPFICRYYNDWTLKWHVGVSEPKKDLKPSKRGHSSSFRIESVTKIDISDYEYLSYRSMWCEKEPKE